MKHVYSFVVWPDETWNFDRAVYDYFRVFRRRTEMHFTEEEFERFRSGMGHHGLTLREVTRRPHAEPEPVPDADAVPHPLPEGGPDDEF